MKVTQPARRFVRHKYDGCLSLYGPSTTAIMFVRYKYDGCLPLVQPSPCAAVHPPPPLSLFWMFDVAVHEPFLSRVFRTRKKVTAVGERESKIGRERWGGREGERDRA